MQTMVLCNSSKKENEYLKLVSKEQIAHCSEEMWNIEECINTLELDMFLETLPIIDIAYLDITLDGGIKAAEKVRSENKNAVLLLIADVNISPMEYMKPTIMAASLLLRPFNKEQVIRAVKEIISFVTDGTNENSEDIFTIESRDEKIKIPYHRICYFEAREKKIFVCLENKDYGFYETMSNLEIQLPDYFKRCHRSFIINTNKISKIKLSSSEIELENEIYIPISRSYRGAMKELRECLK